MQNSNEATYSYKEIYNRAIGTSWWQPAADAKDAAREWIAEHVQATEGRDIYESRCTDDECQNYISAVAKLGLEPQFYADGSYAGMKKIAVPYEDRASEGDVFIGKLFGGEAIALAKEKEKYERAVKFTLVYHGTAYVMATDFQDAADKVYSMKPEELYDESRETGKFDNVQVEDVEWVY